VITLTGDEDGRIVEPLKPAAALFQILGRSGLKVFSGKIGNYALSVERGEFVAHRG